jgi:hypothetical protein
VICPRPYCCYYFTNRNYLCACMLIFSFSSVASLCCITLLPAATLKSAACWSRRKQTWARGAGAKRQPLARSPCFPHSLRCSNGSTTVDWAVGHGRVNVAAYLRGSAAPLE